MNTVERRRRYRMGARADATVATGERIVDAAVALFWEGLADDFTLDQVAARAGVSVQTVIRRFGGKQGLWAAAVEREASKVMEHRGQAVPGDVGGAVAILVEHYEMTGEGTMRLLIEEGRSSAIKGIVEIGRVFHRDWCERVFQPYMSGLKGADRARRLAQFVAICDLYTWKLLRRDHRLSRAQTEQAMIEMLAPFTVEGA